MDKFAIMNVTEVAALLKRFAQLPYEEKKKLADTEVAISNDCAVFAGYRDVDVPDACYVGTIEDDDIPEWSWDVFDLSDFTSGSIEYGSSSGKEKLTVEPWAEDENGEMTYVVNHSGEQGGYYEAIQEILGIK